MTETIGWIIVFVLLLLAEYATLSLMTIWFSVGALVASICSMLNAPLHIQVIAFLVVSVLILFLFRPSAVKYFNKKRTRTNYDSLIGLEAKVIETVDNNVPSGTAMINGLEWMARSVIDDMVIEAGSKARIVKISGVKLILTNKKEEI